MCMSVKSWMGGQDGDVLIHIVLQHQASISMTTSSESVPRGSSHDY
jgi:hypothetical protein